jgi:hypothetical protein
VGNIMCHGSVMLRRGAVLEVGGYDEGCARAQDYDLWLRLSRRFDLANLPEVLYRYHVRDRVGDLRPGQEQAAVAGRALLEHWAGLRGAGAEERGWIEGVIAGALRGDGQPDAALRAAEAGLAATGVSREGLLAWLLAVKGVAESTVPVLEVCRRSRLREVGRELLAAGAGAGGGVWLWGAGRHTAWVLEHRSDLGVRIRGVVDDAPIAGGVSGMKVGAPGDLCAGDHVLLSSDRHEEAMWSSSAPHRERGVRVWRMYGGGAGESGA